MIQKELQQFIEELITIVPVKRMSLPEDVMTLKLHMFLVNKYLVDGGFDKVKARLIADGWDQDPEKFPNKSSLTVSIHSVFAVLGLACQKRWRVVPKIDIKGAFVQTPLHEKCIQSLISSFGKIPVCTPSYSRQCMVVCK